MFFLRDRGKRGTPGAGGRSREAPGPCFSPKPRPVFATVSPRRAGPARWRWRCRWRCRWRWRRGAGRAVSSLLPAPGRSAEDDEESWREGGGASRAAAVTPIRPPPRRRSGGFCERVNEAVRLSSVVAPLDLKRRNAWTRFTADD